VRFRNIWVRELQEQSSVTIRKEKAIFLVKDLTLNLG
jgi:hypothetical protein